jgi:hypothetical protein
MKIKTDEIFKQAHSYLVEKKLAEAEHLFNVLLNNDNNSDTLLFYLGTCYMGMKKTGLAINLFKKALEINPNADAAWCNLGYVYRDEQLLDKARECFLKGIELKPDEPINYANLGATYVANGTPDKMLEYSAKALELDDNIMVARWNQSLAYLELGDYEKGWLNYEFGERVENRAERTYKPQNPPVWDGSKGKTVVVYGEQGIGDEIMFASILPDIMKDCKVILDAHPRLADLFRRSFPNMPVYGTRKDGELFWPGLHQIDAKVAIGTLGKYYRNKAEDFPGLPYLKADPKLYGFYKEKLEALGDKPKIGISWKGGIKNTNVSQRYIKAEQWLPLFKAVDADYISLQYTDDAPEYVQQLEQEHGIIIHHWQDMVDDYDYTAALVSNLDLVISVPQSVVHLAGALGVTTWQLTPKRAMWQMGVYGQDMPWYASVKNYWQDETYTWEPVINLIKEELCHL